MVKCRLETYLLVVGDKASKPDADRGMSKKYSRNLGISEDEGSNAINPSQNGNRFETPIVVEGQPQTNVPAVGGKAEADLRVSNKVTSDAGEEVASNSQNGHRVSNRITDNSGMSNEKEGVNSQKGTHFRTVVVEC